MVWRFIKEHFDGIQARLGLLSQTAVVYVVGSLRDPALRDDARAFFAAHPLEGTQVTLLQGVERADGCVRLVGSQREKLSSWLAADVTASGRSQP